MTKVYFRLVRIKNSDKIEYMVQLELSLPESMIFLMENFIKAGVFHSKEEMLLVALSEFVKKNQVELMDHFANKDIDWILEEKAAV